MFADFPIRGLRRRVPGHAWAGFVLGSMAAIAVAAAPASGQEPGQEPSRVTGRVVDRATGSAIPGAEVTARPVAPARSPEGGIHALADDDGRFELDGVPAGTHALEVRMLGYRMLDDTVAVEPGTWLEIDVRLTAQALELDPVMVVVSRPISREMQGFYQRRRFQVGGDFVTREEIEAVDPHQLTDFLRRYPGVNVMPERRFGGRVSYQVLMRGRCSPTLFIDGAPVFNTWIDETLEPRDIEGIEIYRGPETPARFSRTPCGALVVWTRNGGPPSEPRRGGMSTLQKLLLAGGVLGIFGLVSSL